MRYSIGSGSAAPRSVMGQRPPSACESTCAPISASGSRMRRMGRLRSEASPSNVAVTAWPPTTPIISREPVPALPKSSTSAGCEQAADADAVAPASAPSPRALDDRRPARGRPRAVRSTSSPSSRPSTSVCADRQQAEDQGAVGDRLVAGHADAALERARTGGRKAAGPRREHWATTSPSELCGTPILAAPHCTGSAGVTACARRLSLTAARVARATRPGDATHTPGQLGI